MTLRTITRITLALGILAGLFAGDSPLRAALLPGDYLGTFSGNDSESALFDDLGLLAMQLAKVDLPDVDNGGLSVTNLMLNEDDEPISGEWTYTGPMLVDILVLKAGNMYAAYSYTGLYTEGMLNMGVWDTSDLDDKGLSHATVYKLHSPEPASVSLALLGGALLLAFGRHRRPCTS